MSSKKQLEMQAKFVDLYCETGNARQSAIDAGYKDGKYISNQACNLKRQLANQIQKRMLEMFVDHTPKAFSAMKALMEESESDTVRYQAAKDLMDRAGFKATDKVQIEEDKKDIKQLEAELVSLVGREKADVLLGKEELKTKAAPFIIPEMKEEPVGAIN